MTLTSGRRERDMSRPLPASLSWTVLFAFAAALALATLIAPLPRWIAAGYGGLSILAFAFYAVDKSAARRGAPRVSESTLLTLGLIGGWPGALVAQQTLRHKTRKRSFRRAFWATVVLNVLILAVVVAFVTGALPVG